MENFNNNLIDEVIKERSAGWQDFPRRMRNKSVSLVSGSSQHVQNWGFPLIKQQELPL